MKLRCEYIVLLLLLFQIFMLFPYNYNCLESNLCFKNLSLADSIVFNYECNNTNSLNLPFHPNRKFSSNPFYVVTTIYFYSNIQNYYKYVDFIRSFALSNKGSVLLLISINSYLYKYIKNTKNITEIKKKKEIFYYLHSLDNGYFFFKYKDDKSFCFLIYTNIIQHDFSNSFVNNNHYTKNYKRFPFSGRYAVATNMYSILPFILKIFDYFDYYFKYDFDKPGIINIRDFAFGNIHSDKWYLFGTCLRLDSPFVCTNVKLMMLDYVKKRNCSANIISSVDLLTNECVQFPGWFTGMWLGFYSSREIRDFSRYYIEYDKGIKYFRWGDQQFFANSLLLFSGRNKIFYNLSFNCEILLSPDYIKNPNRQFFNRSYFYFIK